MNEPKRHADPSPAPPTPAATREGQPGSYTRRAEAGVDRHRAIGRHLEAVRARLDEAIASCVRHESQGDFHQTDQWGRVTHRHLTEIDSLRRLKDHLERLTARFRNTVPRDKPYGEADPLLVLEFALIGCAGSIAQHFEAANDRHDLLADLESDLCTFERLLDERAAVNFKGQAGRQPTPAAPDPAAGPGEAARGDLRGAAVPDAPGEPPGSPRRVERGVRAVESDPPLQAFWRGASAGIRRESDQPSPSIIVF